MFVLASNHLKEHTHKCTQTPKRGRRMRNKRENALKPLKTHIQNSDPFRDNLGVLIGSQREKNRKHISNKSQRHCLTDYVPWCKHGTHIGGCYSTDQICVHVRMGSLITCNLYMNLHDY